MKIGRTLLVLSTLSFGLLLTACKSCVEQHNPRPIQTLQNQEAARANAPQEKLNADGTAPAAAPTDAGAAPAVAGGAKSPGVEKFEQFCAACHGVDGQANGPSAQAMNPKPRNFTDARWQESVDDAHIAKVIKEGGASVGLSATMAPWGSVVSDSEVKEIIAHIRSLKK